MAKTDLKRMPINHTLEDFILTWIDGFLKDRKISGFSNGTMTFYKTTLRKFTDFCDSQEITLISQITPNDIRQYLLDLEVEGHTPGGRHAYFRAIRTFLYWYEREAEPDNWKNPIRKVNPPKLAVEPIQGVDIQDFHTLLSVAKSSSFPQRNIAVLLALLDTGARATEFCSMQLEDLNLIIGSILIPKGKGSKPRTVFIGKKTRKAIRAYLKVRTDNDFALWVTDEGEPLKPEGLRQIIKRFCLKAEITVYSPHDFRRAFALNMLRNGCDIFTLARLMGHSNIQVLQRYLAQDSTDAENAHHQFGFVDKL